ncbi:MAG: hypothetical protein OXC95_14285 [Dehalococcoidia bacterium]|nr:hypothetical protein [Dehalococcoidia bacterium]
MSAPFKIDYEWLYSEDGDEAEQATLAQLSIRAGEHCATEVEDTLATSVRPYARLSALRLAEWFATNWWRLLWEPEANSYSWRASHKIGNAGGGYAWPDLSFSSDWQSVTLSANPTQRRNVEPIRYLNRFETPISIEDFEIGVSNFIEGTIARLFSVSRGETDLNLLWSEVLEERRDPDASHWRGLEACMGYDPDEAPDGLIDSLLKQMHVYGSEGIRETAVEAKAMTVSYVSDLRNATIGSEGVSVHVPKRDEILRRVQIETEPSDIPWKRAEQAAQVAREVWNLSVPVETRQLSDLFHISESQFSGPANSHNPLTAGFRDLEHHDGFRLSWSSARETSRRFALARLAADHIVTSDNESLLPATRSRTSRQKFQRAFAQDLLCPFSALVGELGDETPDADRVDAIGERFHVSPLLVQTTLVNKGILNRNTLAYWDP